MPYRYHVPGVVVYICNPSTLEAEDHKFELHRENVSQTRKKNHCIVKFIDKDPKLAGHWWLMPVVLATWDTDQKDCGSRTAGQVVLKTPSPK
jgi:hypothetical protein